ncbi:MAG TPA: phage major capsid protein, partial [Stellaceae bacterium]|nr:phage major capsid protein [Stellaceae bacterium]
MEKDEIMNLAAIQRRQTELLAKARAIVAGAHGRTMTGSEGRRFQGLLAHATLLGNEIRICRDLEDAEHAAAADRAGNRPFGRMSQRQRANREDIEWQTFDRYLRAGLAGLDEYQRVIASRRFQAAQGTDSGPSGGYTVPQGFYTEIMDAQLAYGGMITPGVCSEVATDTGNPVPIPTDNDTSNEGVILGENTQVVEQ